jgi:hypothetical protein
MKTIRIHRVNPGVNPLYQADLKLNNFGLGKQAGLEVRLVVQEEVREKVRIVENVTRDVEAIL